MFPASGVTKIVSLLVISTHLRKKKVMNKGSLRSGLEKIKIQIILKNVL